MPTVKQAKEALDSVQAAYISADIEHPTAVSLAKSALNEARMEYWLACVNVCERLEWMNMVTVEDFLQEQGVWS
jgi:hypothetical protein